MTRSTMTHDFACDPDTFWTTFFDRAFNDALYLKYLGFPSFRVEQQDDTEREIHRVISAIPKVDLPAAVTKLLGPGFGYREDGRFDRQARTYRFQFIPSVLADKLRSSGLVRTEPTATGCRRVVELEIDVKMFGVGGLLESTGVKQLRVAWEASVPFMRKWLAGRQEAR